jgi:hypothetical protein
MSEIKKTKTPKDSFSFGDFKEFWTANDLLFTIVQDSIRFEKFKEFAIYKKNDYLGKYKVVDKSIFKAKNISNMLSLMAFGVNKEFAQEFLKNKPFKGRFSHEASFALVCLTYEGYDVENRIERREIEPFP